MHDDYLLETHREWIGYVQPVGLLVAPAALVNRNVFPDRNAAELQEQLDVLTLAAEDTEAVVSDFVDFAISFCGWERDDLAGASKEAPLPEELCANLIEYGEILTPTYAVRSVEGAENEWQMLISVEASNVDFDTVVADDGRHWSASPHARFERLLRETGIPVGLLTNLRSFRLVYAPKGETSGFATFDLKSMLEVAGRPMLAAFHMLLRFERLFGRPEDSLSSLLAESRQYQETVSTQLAEQVLVALNELLRGLHAADLRAGYSTIVALARTDPDHLYSGLLTALMRLVFILYAEDRDLFPRNPVWEQHYSLGGLFERLRDDAALYPDTMDSRYGAWAQLLVLWRLMYSGGQHDSLKLVARRGQIFNPQRFPFLEHATDVENSDIPAVSDGVVWRVLESLMVLDGERLSYRTLDVEQIGSVYQSVMGFTIELTQGTSIAIRPAKRGGAAATINVDELLAEVAAKRPEWIRERTDRKLTAKQLGAIKGVASVADVQSALSSIIDERITSKPLPAGVPVLQPTQARRRTGSHYTPRQLTAPIVAEALRPVLERLGEKATPEQILDLKVLDPALGSGAFLVEACRQLSERLVRAWEYHDAAPPFPPDEDALLYARRLIAQRCLYGVDRNPMAADLAKLSLWLATLARDHEFTFIDHAIKHGDALVGLFRDQIAQLNWKGEGPQTFAATLVDHALAEAQHIREQIRTMPERPEDELCALLIHADAHLASVSILADALVQAFFSSDKPKVREQARRRVESTLALGDEGWQARLESAMASFKHVAVSPFHWELQFPEVFLRKNYGFDAIIGNPPYAGKNGIIEANPPSYLSWLQTIHEDAHGNADLVAHFFRRAFTLLRDSGALGLIATNTIRQGDTRATGLRWIRKHNGVIYSAKRRYKWPGEAAVIVSVVHIAKGQYAGLCFLDGRAVQKITAYLFDQGTDDDPSTLSANLSQSFIGCYVLGMGFTFDDTDTKGVASPIALMHELIRKDSKNRERIFPYIGGEEVNTDPLQRHHRFVINFEDMQIEKAMQWPELLHIVEARVKPTRTALPPKNNWNRSVASKWWLFGAYRRELHRKLAGLERALVVARVGERIAFAFLPTRMVFSEQLVVFAIDDYAGFAVLQSRVHEVWARFFGSTMKDDLRYTPTDVYETFAFPSDCFGDSNLENAGRAYYEHRQRVMLQTGNGLTATYNRFNDPSDMSEDVEVLRQLHSKMDRAVLAAYGWADIDATPVFEPEWRDDDGVGPIKYRWPEETRDAVLARMLNLNAKRASEEARSGASVKTLPQPTEGEPELEEV